MSMLLDQRPLEVGVDDIDTPADLALSLRQAIVQGDKQPGTRLAEYQLAAEHNMSRAHVREALWELEHAGLVIREVNRAAQVRRITRAEAAEVLEALRTVEVSAAVAASAHFGASISEPAAGQVDDPTVTRERIVDMAGNPIVARIHHTLLDQLRLFYASNKGTQPSTEVRDCLRDAVDAIRAHDRESAAFAMHRCVQFELRAVAPRARRH